MYATKDFSALILVEQQQHPFPMTNALSIDQAKLVKE